MIELSNRHVQRDTQHSQNKSLNKEDRHTREIDKIRDQGRGTARNYTGQETKRVSPKARGETVTLQLDSLNSIPSTRFPQLARNGCGGRPFAGSSVRTINIRSGKLQESQTRTVQREHREGEATWPCHSLLCSCRPHASDHTCAIALARTQVQTARKG